MDKTEEHLSPEKMVSISKKFFYLGFLCLPFLWLVNAFFFRRYYSHSGTPAIVRKYVVWSLVSFAIVFPGWMIWMIYFLATRESWSYDKDWVTVNVPKG